MQNGLKLFVGTLLFVLPQVMPAQQDAGNADGAGNVRGVVVEEPGNVRGVDVGESGVPPAEGNDDDDVFIPTEEIPADEEITFPVDI